MTRPIGTALAAASALLLLAAPASAQIAAGFQEYYVVGRASQVYGFMNAVYRQGNGEDLPDPGLVSVIGIVATLDGQIVVYDHWEDGYEADPLDPKQGTTEVYGVPGGLTHGQSLNLASDGDCTGAKTCYVPTPRGTEVRYDGGDKVVSIGGPLNLVVNMYPIETDQMGGAWEVYARQTLAGSREYRIPIGVDLYPGANNAYRPFQFVDLEVVSYEDGNNIVVNNGQTTVSLTLDRGQSYSTRGAIDEGAGRPSACARGHDRHQHRRHAGRHPHRPAEQLPLGPLTAIPVKLWGRDYVLPIVAMAPTG
jgi:hypothetical protein